MKNTNKNTKESKREQLRQRAKKSLSDYLQYVDNLNVHTKPEKGKDSGAEGRAFERSLNYYMGLYNRSQTVQKQNKKDTVKYIVVDGKRRQLKIEDKIGCGALATIDENGNIIESQVYSSDFIIYAPFFRPLESIEEQAIVLETSIFIDILKECGLIRVKRSGYQQKRKKMGLDNYCDIQSIQSFKNSKKKMEKFFDMLSYEGLVLNDFIDFYGITINK